jgi:hypothetical protein
MPNQCAMEIAKATGQAQEPCWCVNAYFTPELLAKLPEEAKGQACICAGCAAKAAQPAQTLHSIALTMSSTTFLASPNTIMVLSM